MTLLPILAVVKFAVEALGTAITFLWHNVFQPIVNFITAPLRAAWDLLNGDVGAAKRAFNDLIGPIKGVLGALGGIADWVTNAGSNVLGFFGNLLGITGSGGSNLPNLGTTLGNPLGSLGSAAGAAIQGGIPPPIPGFLPHVGTKIARARAHIAAPAGGASFHGHFTHNLIVDGRVLARVHRRETIKAMAAGA